MTSGKMDEGEAVKSNEVSKKNKPKKKNKKKGTIASLTIPRPRTRDG
jgi:hypothetical protein